MGLRKELLLVGIHSDVVDSLLLKLLPLTNLPVDERSESESSDVSNRGGIGHEILLNIGFHYSPCFLCES